MDVTSYLLGKQAGGGGGGGVEEYFVQDISGLSSIQAPVVRYVLKKIPNFTIKPSITDATSWFSYCTNLEVAPLFNTENITSMQGAFENCKSLKEFPNYNILNNKTLYNTFRNCSALETATLLDTSGVTQFYGTFYGCSELKNVPQYSFASATSLQNMFDRCYKLTDQSLDNILLSCIGATSYTGTKKLSVLGISTSRYPASRLETLPHYQDFINAGWTL